MMQSFQSAAISARCTIGWRRAFRHLAISECHFLIFDRYTRLMGFEIPLDYIATKAMRQHAPTEDKCRQAIVISSRRYISLEAMTLSDELSLSYAHFSQNGISIRRSRAFSPQCLSRSSQHTQRCLMPRASRRPRRKAAGIGSARSTDAAWLLSNTLILLNCMLSQLISFSLRAWYIDGEAVYFRPHMVLR